ncbi:MAG: GIY-YIG nuclease family protein [Chloroflexota bacterium]|nr:GIY-YIG nuclease family protein [Chloroflexota bacterium]
MDLEELPRSDHDVIPRQPGTYVLLLHLLSPTEIRVGKLGTSRFPTGWYTYVGSALGPGGLAARLARHQRRRRLHWHIDYLLALSGLVEIWWTVSPKRWECVWAQALKGLPGAAIPMLGFGASDCRCSTHLLHFDHHLSPSALAAQLEGPCTIHRTLLSG